MVSQAQQRKRNRKRRSSVKVAKEKPLQLKEGSAQVTLNDVYAMFYVLVRQNKAMAKDNVMSFPLGVFKTLPKSPQLTFEQVDGHLIVDIPENKDDKKSDLYLPDKQIIQKG